MGSSKSGSLDKFASFSPVAALASGKVKLPETGIVGMLQARQEDKMNRGAQMAQQEDDQMAQYMQMMQQQGGMNMGGRVEMGRGGMTYKDVFNDAYYEFIDEGFSEEEAVKKATEAMENFLGANEYAAGGPVESMNFLKQHLPYQDGGHVALRRKMFKLGGPVNTHGVGITSGLEYRNNYNAGGPVVKPGPDGQMRQHAKIGGILKLLGKIPGFAVPRGKKFTSDIADLIRGSRKAKDASFLSKRGTDIARAARAGTLASLATSPLTATSIGLDYAGSDYADPDQPVREDAKLAERIVRRGLQAGEFATDYLNPVGDAFLIGDALFKDPKMETRTFTDFLKGKEREEIAKLDTTGVASKSQMTLDELREQNAAENQARMQAAMEQYAELLAGSDDTNKLATLGDALIAGGSALMEGEGYGAAGRAFNEPLSGARRSKEERMSAANQAAAQLAISENMQIDAENRAVVNEFMKTGSFTDAEQAQLMALAQQTGGARLIPENEDGEIDEDVVNQPGVYADPKNLSGKGSLFIAIDSSGTPIYTNDPQEARAHAAS
tara:strand:+ start:2063 stop:3721 length:1659 start_codon:yes stop_codon:yes gene_type:complete